MELAGESNCFTNWQIFMSLSYSHFIPVISLILQYLLVTQICSSKNWHYILQKTLDKKNQACKMEKSKKDQISVMFFFLQEILWTQNWLTLIRQEITVKPNLTIIHVGYCYMTHLIQFELFIFFFHSHLYDRIISHRI